MGRHLGAAIAPEPLGGVEATAPLGGVMPVAAVDTEAVLVESLPESTELSSASAARLSTPVGSSA
ncbi:hypothetical protein [Nocardia sp. NPDC058633]|uniref:hypothetical protein n=1 Tax=Nocardia sp. NPDC058633 TaxID=3346568 RepID=UPI003654A20E